MTAPTPLARPGTEQPPLRPSVFVLLASALVTAALTGAAVALAPESVQTPLAWGAGAASLALTASVTLAFHSIRTNALLRRRVAAVQQDAERLVHEQAARSEEFHRERTALTEHFVRERNELTVRARTAESERAAALAASANAAGRMQALATGMLADLREMEGRHADEDVLTDLLHLDHRTAQAGRIADSVAVLTGARSGRRWARPIVMESILRGAMGRIGGYQRVRVHSASEVAVAGHAAEGVMHALAELLDNAANFSPPTSEVHVYIEEVAAGVIISVEDSGLVMGPVQQRRAEQAVSGETKGLSGLSGTRLGLAVVGRLARKHGLTVSFRPSARGGTGVLLLIPQELLSRPSETTPTPVPASLTAATALPTPPSTPEGTRGDVRTEHRANPDVQELPTRRRDGEDVRPPAVPRPQTDPGHTAEGGPDAPLPKRPRGRTLAAAERARADSDTGETRRPRAATAADTAARFSSFRQAVRTTPTDPSAPSADVDVSPDATATPSHPEGDTPR
ncbi:MULTISPECIES: ATP-binding protein [unclassified Streptomyces]|nr:MULTISPECIES: ATP-binding protein [unclassified Streptomyces]MYY85957.1 ATP-binding protein [Streptomyces sp. SID335]MYZ14829.1 ATP-binding protein [Streptomyces sp. SID337]NEB43136.1 ATP-binding protein [Streptomyces sp. SID339]